MDSDMNAEMHKRIIEAIEDPFVRVGTIRGAKDSLMDGLPCLAVTFTWMEPADDDNMAPGVVAIELLIPQPLVSGAVGVFRGR